MSISLPVMFHWSKVENRVRINRRGLKPITPTVVTIFQMPLTTGRLGHHTVEEELIQLYCVCLGTTPSHAWSLSGDVCAKRGEVWDLWQVTLDEGDAVYPQGFQGYRWEEFRVANWIPKSRVWFVGSRRVGFRSWSHEEA